jgi:hypothetical protein
MRSAVTVAVIGIGISSALAQSHIEIKENPDNVPVEVRIVQPDAAVVTNTEFRAGWDWSFPVLKVKEQSDRHPGTFVLLVEWKVKEMQNLAPQPVGVGPYLTGVGDVERVGFVGAGLKGAEVIMAQHKETRVFGPWTTKDGVVKFLWFVPKQTQTFGLVLPPNKTITVTLRETAKKGK